MAANVKQLWKPDLQFTCPRCHFAASAATMSQAPNSFCNRRQMIRPLLFSIVSWLFFALPAICADIDAASINTLNSTPQNLHPRARSMRSS